MEKVYYLKKKKRKEESTHCYNSNSPEKQLTKKDQLTQSKHQLASSRHRSAIVCTSWGGGIRKELPTATEVPCHCSSAGRCMDTCFPTRPAVCDMEIQDASLQDYSSGTCTSTKFTEEKTHIHFSPRVHLFAFM